MTRAEEQFRKLDANSDGFVTAEEIAAAHAERAEKHKDRGDMFSKLDADKDGAISVEEYAKAGEKHGRRHERKAGHGEHGHKRGDKDAAPADAPKTE